MRVGRALERLRRHLARQGVVMGTVALAALLSEKAVEVAPVPTSPLPSVPDLRAQELTKGTLKAMSVMKLKLAALTAAGLCLAGTGALVAHAQLTQTQLIQPQNAPVQMSQAPVTPAQDQPALPPPPHHEVGVLAGIQAQYDRLAQARGAAALTAVEDVIYASDYTVNGKPVSRAQRLSAVQQEEIPGATVRERTFTIHGLTAKGGVGVETAVVQMWAHTVQVTPPDAQGHRHRVEDTPHCQDTSVMIGDDWRLKNQHVLSRHTTVGLGAVK